MSAHKEFLITVKEQCPDCKGVGITTNSVWPRIWEDEKKYIHTNPGVAFDFEVWLEEWAKAHGYVCACNLGAEEVPCSECEGIGFITRQGTVKEALDSMGYCSGQPFISGLDDLQYALNELGISV
ncbi:hypothetical protein MCAMS1_02831 [biofilm metagenome]